MPKKNNKAKNASPVKEEAKSTSTVPASIETSAPRKGSSGASSSPVRKLSAPTGENIKTLQAQLGLTQTFPVNLEKSGIEMEKEKAPSVEVKEVISNLIVEKLSVSKKEASSPVILEKVIDIAPQQQPTSTTTTINTTQVKKSSLAIISTLLSKPIVQGTLNLFLSTYKQISSIAKARLLPSFVSSKITHCEDYLTKLDTKPAIDRSDSFIDDVVDSYQNRKLFSFAFNTAIQIPSTLLSLYFKK